jgi:hypothetical protein
MYFIIYCPQHNVLKDLFVFCQDIEIPCSSNNTYLRRRARYYTIVGRHK